MMSRIKTVMSSLGRLDKRRAELAMAWAQRNKAATSVYNLGNYLFLGCIKAGLGIARLLTGFRTGTGFAPTPVPDSAFPLPQMPERPRVLMIVEDSIPQCFQYRVQQKLDMLSILGWETRWIRWSSTEEIYRSIHWFDVVILYRVPGFPAVMSLVQYLTAINKLLICDIDDLIFDRRQLEIKFSGKRGQLTRKTINDLLVGADLYRAVLESVPFCIVSTVPLKNEVEKIGITKAFVLPNGVSDELHSLESSSLAHKTDSGLVNILYGSGTSTHDADFNYVSNVLQVILTEHTFTRLIIVGPVNISDTFGRFGDRVLQIDLLDYSAYLEMLACATISIAPLEAGIFADCKSEIKWLEAGMLGVPSIVSASRAYESVVEHGVTGMIAGDQDEWRLHLTTLVTQPELRHKIALAAKQHILENYGLEGLTSRFSSIIKECSSIRSTKGEEPPSLVTKRRLLVVNTLYPPQNVGGATRVAEDLVATLKKQYANEYDIQVFTCDIASTQPYRVRQYLRDDVIVTTLSVPMRADLEVQYTDELVKSTFNDLLDYFVPDIVHFHSMQRLTASPLEATAEAGIPFVVTLHDSWWFSDQPFMVDKESKKLPADISNPLVLRPYTDDLNETLRRNRYLRKQLDRSKRLIAVSDYQASLYQENGFSDLHTVDNGVDKPAGYKPSSHSNQLVLGYMGGISTHKGYFFLKENISCCRLQNIRLINIDFFSKSEQIDKDTWGTTQVETFPGFDHSNIADFYSMIDVLVVPSLAPESFGLVVREASLLGIRSVVSSFDSLTNCIIQGESGLSFEPGNDGEFVAILEELDRNWQLYKTPIDDETIKKLNIISVSQNTEQIHKIYSEILQHR